MTMRSGAPVDPPQAAQAPTDPADSALENVADAVEQGREQISEARQAALDAARSDAERAQINARFDAIGEQFGEFTSRIEAAVSSGNDRVVEALSGVTAALTATKGQGADASDAAETDAEILSVEEITDALTDGVSGAAGAVGDAAGAAVQAAETAVDAAPKRAHALFRPLWGGNK